MTLQWVMKRGICLRDFIMEVDGISLPGSVILKLMTNESRRGGQDISTYFAERDKLVSLNIEHDGQTALTFASCRGNLNTLKSLLAAGADIGKTTQDGWVALMLAARGGVHGGDGLIRR